MQFLNTLTVLALVVMSFALIVAVPVLYASSEDSGRSNRLILLGSAVWVALVLLNWGVALAQHAALLDTTPALDLYQAATNKFAGTLDIDAKVFDALFNWGNTLTQQAGRMGDSEAASAVYQNASDKFGLFVQVPPECCPCSV